ncbi:hypothetical protein GCM10017710_49070 [Arthrobacter ramosus]
MLDQSQEVGAGGGHGPADVVLVESVKLGEELGATGAQVFEQNRFVIHPGTIPLPSRVCTVCA